MKNIYTFGRRPGQRNYTVRDLLDLKTTGQRLTMVNPANAEEISACVDAGVDILTCWDSQIELRRELAPTHYVGTAICLTADTACPAANLHISSFRPTCTP